MLRTNGAAMNKYIEQQFAALRYEKNILQKILGQLYWRLG